MKNELFIIDQSAYPNVFVYLSLNNLVKLDEINYYADYEKDLN